jgi:hypothetical protein
VYVSASPPLRDTPRSGWRELGLGLAVTERQEFAPDLGRYTDLDRVYFADLLALHGLPYRNHLLDAGRTTFREMMARLLDRLNPHHHGYDVAVLASCTPDAEPGWPVPFLSDSAVRPGLAFAVSDQGPLAPFTALELIADIAAADRAGRALMIAMDQCARQHEEPVPVRTVASRNAAVALVLDGSTHASVRVRLSTGVVAADVDRLLADAGTGTLLVGTGLAGRVSGARVAPPGTPCTGPWSLLADALADPEPARYRLVVANYDEDLGYLGVCVVDPAGTGR